MQDSIATKGNLGEFRHLKIELEAIKSATNKFDDAHCIGKGGFGKVYKAELVHSKGRSVVALKRLNRAFGQGDLEFWKEIILLSLFRHDNIVSLLGFCDDCGEKILVYEYASKRSLDLYLNDKDLTWVQRLEICIGAARGLAYLHNPGRTQQRVLHRDIKSSNILLDDDWNARIADLGLSKFGPANQKYTFLVSNAVGTIGYCDPLYVETGLLTKESDVYSFGVVLFELLCGRLSIGNSRDERQPLTELVRKCYKQNTMDEIIFGNIKHEINPHSLKAFTTIAYQCLMREQEQRPLMTKVVKVLESALQLQCIDKDNELDLATAEDTQSIILYKMFFKLPQCELNVGKTFTKDAGNMSVEELVSWAEEEATMASKACDDDINVTSVVNKGKGLADKGKGIMVDKRKVGRKSPRSRNSVIVIRENVNPTFSEDDDSDSDIDIEQRFKGSVELEEMYKGNTDSEKNKRAVIANLKSNDTHEKLKDIEKENKGNTSNNPTCCRIEGFLIVNSDVRSYGKFLELLGQDIDMPNGNGLTLISDQHKFLHVIPAGGNLFEVRNGSKAFKVDEHKRTCTCRMWQLAGLPCPHSIAVIFKLNKSPEDYIPDCFRKDAYYKAYHQYFDSSKVHLAVQPGHLAARLNESDSPMSF
ncbi:protein kinase, ATP binding site-containing protein [Tanacetum coccineum]